MLMILGKKKKKLIYESIEAFKITVRPCSDRFCTAED